MSEYQFKDFDFRGNPFKVACVETYPYHPTWFTFVDESEVRNNFWHIAPGDRVLDVGAAFGSYTLCALAAGAEMVWAWAPQGIPGAESEEETLKASLEANGWSHKCRIFTTGVFDKSGYLHAGDQSFTEEPREGWEILHVEKLDDWATREIPNESRIDWMKLDVEGAEVEVIRGGSDLIQKYRPRILVENHAFKKADIESDVESALNSITRYKKIATTPHHGVTHSYYEPE